MKPRLYHHHDGARVAYREAGTGLPLALLHSPGLSHREFAPVADELAERYRLVLPTCPATAIPRTARATRGHRSGSPRSSPASAAKSGDPGRSWAAMTSGPSCYCAQPPRAGCARARSC